MCKNVAVIVMLSLGIHLLSIAHFFYLWSPLRAVCAQSSISKGTQTAHSSLMQDSLATTFFEGYDLLAPRVFTLDLVSL